MKCKICGKKGFRTLPGIAAHYRKKHPQKMKRHSKSRSQKGGVVSQTSQVKRLLDGYRLPHGYELVVRKRRG